VKEIEWRPAGPKPITNHSAIKEKKSFLFFIEEAAE